MKMSQYNKCLQILQQLKINFPKYTLGQHLSTVVDEYKNLWGVSDKDLLASLIEYQNQLQTDIPHDDELDEIITLVEISRFVKGISDAIEKRFSGAFAPIGGFYG